MLTLIASATRPVKHSASSSVLETALGLTTGINHQLFLKALKAGSFHVIDQAVSVIVKGKLQACVAIECNDMLEAGIILKVLHSEFVNSGMVSGLVIDNPNSNVRVVEFDGRQVYLSQALGSLSESVPEGGLTRSSMSIISATSPAKFLTDVGSKL